MLPNGSRIFIIFKQGRTLAFRENIIFKQEWIPAFNTQEWATYASFEGSSESEG